MEPKLRDMIIKSAEAVIDDRDPSHDRYHMRRVLSNAEYIARKEGGDLYVLVPMAAFHDAVVYPKCGGMSRMSAQVSADIAGQRLRDIADYDNSRIPEVMAGIREHSPRYGGRPTSFESKILQDADSLEKVGAIAVMRSYCSGGQMGRGLFCDADPLCESREFDASSFTLDYLVKLFRTVSFHTLTAAQLAHDRKMFLLDFMRQARQELYAVRMP